MQINNIFEPDNFKVPSIAGTIGFILIFFINIIVGNTFFVIFTRSLIYGIIVFSIFFGIIVLFKNYLNADSEEKEASNEKDKNKVNVDITLDDEAFDEKPSNKINLDIGDEIGSEDDILFARENMEEQLNEDNNIGDISAANDKSSSAVMENKDFFNDDEIEEKTNLKEQLIPSHDAKSNENIDEDNGSSKIMEDNKEVDDIYFSLNDDSDKESKSVEKDLDTEKSFKNKIGVNVSFEEVAKAIRTKIKEE